jgi:succinoglycan biosynthesis transport protein ExoP
LKQELSALEKESGGIDARDEVSKQLMAARAALADLRARANDSHPDLIRAQEVVVSLERELRAAIHRKASPSTIKPENPAYIMAGYTKRLEMTPTIEPEYLDLTRDRENSVRKHQGITSRLLEAQVSAELEVQRKGERFSLINPPELPEKPDRPNRRAILFLGALFALCGGIGAGVAADNFDGKIHTMQQLGRTMRTVPLVAVPYMPTEGEMAALGRRRMVVSLAGLGAMLVAVILVHLTWRPLDVLWYQILRKLG